MSQLGGGLIGEIIGVIALGAILHDRLPKSIGAKLCAFMHGVLVLAGVDFLLYQFEFTLIHRVANWFAFCALGAACGLVASDKPGAALRNLVMPFMMAAIVTVGAVATGELPKSDAWVNALSYLGLYYYVISGGFFLTILIAPFMSATPDERKDLLKTHVSGFGLFWIVLQCFWWWQLYIVLKQHGGTIFSGGVWHVVFGVVAFLWGTGRIIKRGYDRLDL